MVSKSHHCAHLNVNDKFIAQTFFDIPPTVGQVWAVTMTLWKTSRNCFAIQCFTSFQSCTPEFDIWPESPKLRQVRPVWLNAVFLVTLAISTPFLEKGSQNGHDMIGKISEVEADEWRRTGSSECQFQGNHSEEQSDVYSSPRVQFSASQCFLQASKFGTCESGGNFEKLEPAQPQSLWLSVSLTRDVELCLKDLSSATQGCLSCLQ